MRDGLTKALGPERHRKLAKRMGMGVWQNSEDYAIMRINESMDEGNGEGSNVVEV